MRLRGQFAGTARGCDRWRVAIWVSCSLSLCSLIAAKSVNAQTGDELRKPVVDIALEEKVSDAERVARLQRTIDTDEILLRDLKAELDNPEGQYEMADAEFKKLDRELTRLKKEQQKLRDQAQTDDVAALQTQIESTEKKWKLAKDRFAVAIEERKNLAGKIATLDEKLRKDRSEVNRLTGMPDASAPRTDAAALGKENPPAATGSPNIAPPVVSLAAPITQPLPSAAQTAAAAAAASPVTAPPGIPAPTPELPAPAPALVVGPSAPPAKIFNEALPSKELVKARDEAKVKEVVAQQAQEEAATFISRIEDLHKLIQQERKSMELAGKKSDLATRTERALELELESKLSEGVHWTGLQELRRKIAEANRHDEEARAESRDASKRLDDLQSELAGLNARQIAAMKDAEKRRLEAEVAQKKVEQLENPLAPKNLARWFVEHGPRLLGCLVGMVVLLWLTRRLERRLIAMGTASSLRGSTLERENRTRTLAGVFHNAASTAVVITGTVLVLNELGVNVALLMGGAAVFGLAVAFGTQNLIRDYFHGFVVLLENQYRLNDVVQIGTISGQVERITLRMTVLRDLEGCVHFIPNGQISSVSNKTHGWSRALFEIPVAYKEDVDRVMEILVDVGRQLRKDPQYSSSIVEDLTMLGLDAFADSALIIKFYMKTKPLQQWTIKREMLLRIKKRFDLEQIEIPFPHRTIYHHNLTNDIESVEMSTKAAERQAA